MNYIGEQNKRLLNSNKGQKIALDWKPQDERKKGRPRTWKSTIELELQKAVKSWKKAKVVAVDRT